MNFKLNLSTYTFENGRYWANGYLESEQRSIPVKIDITKIVTSYSKMVREGKKFYRTNAVVISL